MTNARHFNWGLACNGTEEEFQGLDGKTYQYMWNGIVGKGSEHAYYCKNDDLFLDYEECKGRVFPV